MTRRRSRPPTVRWHVIPVTGVGHFFEEGNDPTRRALCGALGTNPPVVDANNFRTVKSRCRACDAEHQRRFNPSAVAVMRARLVGARS